MPVTNIEAVKFVAKALNAGHTLSIACPNGDTLTVGRNGHAVQEGTNDWFHALRWGRSRIALPSGKEVASDPQAESIAVVVVEHCGRGNAARAVRKITG